MKKASLVLVLIIITGMLAGCWDKIEIEERLFVLAVGIDKSKAEERNEPKDKYLLSFAAPKVSELSGGGGGGGEGGAGGKSFNTFKTVGDTVSISLNQMYARYAKHLSFEHTRVLVFGEELLKEEKMFREALDAISREHEFHMSMYVFVVPGKAEEAFMIEPAYTSLLAMYITGVADNEGTITRISKMPAYELFDNLLNQEGNSIIPRLIPVSDNEVKIVGMGVIKNYKLIGYIEEDDSIYTRWLMGTTKAGIVEVDVNNLIIPYRYNEFKRTIKLDRVENDKIYLSYNMETEGTVDEYIWDKNILNQKTIDNIEEAIKSKIEKESLKMVEKFKNQYQVDLIGAKEYLQKFQPDLYASIKGDYENYFKNNIVIDVKAKVKIRRVGVTE